MSEMNNINLNENDSSSKNVAEEKSATNKGKKKEFSDSTLKYELDVYKEELKMQNVELLDTQAKLLKSISEFTELFEQAPIGYFILDKDGLILNVNETGRKQLKGNKKQLLNKHFSIFINSKSCQDRFYQHKNLVIETRKKKQFEAKLKLIDGTNIFSLIETSFVKDEKNHFKFLFCTVSDISKQKEQERILELALVKEKKLNEMKSQFITIASHEFRTPLATILTSAELMEKYTSLDQDENRVKHYKKIRTAVSRLGEILIDFLSANDIEKGKIKNHPELFNLVEFTNKIIDDTKSFNGTHLIKYNHIGNYENVFLDMKLLKTCITNLLINAYKYSPDGGLIDITTKHTVPDGVIITVSDYGIGIPKKDQGNIFETFFRAKNAENFQGTGMGLSITQQFVKIMKGQISFTSQENKGTTFTIKLPQ
jgi:PAS domain S-box-containing protein